MPTYEYLCNKCEYAFEAVQSFTEATLEVCPKCNAGVRKVYNNVGVVFKGSGFYKTDSRSSVPTKSEPAAAKSEPAAAKSEPAAAKSEPAAAKVESKPTKKSTD